MDDSEETKETAKSKQVNKDYADRLKGMLKAELKRRNVSYKQLAEKLQEMGLAENDRSINNKISRGSFTAVFLVQCLTAIGCQTLNLTEV